MFASSTVTILSSLRSITMGTWKSLQVLKSSLYCPNYNCGWAGSLRVRLSDGMLFYSNIVFVLLFTP